MSAKSGPKGFFERILNTETLWFTYGVERRAPYRCRVQEHETCCEILENQWKRQPLLQAFAGEAPATIKKGLCRRLCKGCENSFRVLAALDLALVVEHCQRVAKAAVGEVGVGILSVR